MAVFNEPSKWASTLGASADRVTIPDTAGATDPSIDKIFPSVFSIPLASGGRAIPRTVLNGLFKLIGDWVYYIQNGGVASYSNTLDYPAGALVKRNDGLYFCIQANGIGSTVAPPPDRSYWLQIASSDPWSLFPTGFKIEWTSKRAIPSGWLIMNGQSVSKAKYIALNAFINSDGSLDDSGDSSKFIIPDMTGRVWQGCSSYSDVLVAKEAGLPNITGNVFQAYPNQIAFFDNVTGAFNATKNASCIASQSGTGPDRVSSFELDASRSSSIYKNINTVQPPSRQALMLIKI